MNDKEIIIGKKVKLDSLQHGLYEVFWASGGESLASIGSFSDGSKWIAPCNWTSNPKSSPVGKLSEKRHMIGRIELIKSYPNTDFPEFFELVQKPKWTDKDMKDFAWRAMHVASDEAMDALFDIWQERKKC